jgi:hypothetical protein
LLKPLKVANKKLDFSPHAFLSTIGKGRKMMPFERKATIFAQGDSTDSGTSASPEDHILTAYSKRKTEPPTEPGLPPDKERAKKPPLSGLRISHV